MKTKEQIKSEIINYLNKASMHTFNVNFTKSNNEVLSTELKVFIEGDNYILIDGNYINVYNINSDIDYYGSNAKCVIKNKLFLIPRYYNKKLVTIKTNKEQKTKYSKIKELISGKVDKNEIKNIIFEIIK